MFGVILFVLVLLVYGFILSRTLLARLFPTASGEEVKGVARFLQTVDQFMENKGVKFIFSISALILGIWNLFAPDFNAGYSTSIIGALLPSLILILDGLIIDVEIIEFLNIPQEAKDKYYAFIDRVKDFMGIVTLVAAILHMAFFKQILL